MRVRFEVTPAGGDPVEVVAGPADVVAFERAHNLSAAVFEDVDQVRYEHLCWLAWHAAKRHGQTDADLDGWLAGLDALRALPARPAEDPPVGDSPNGASPASRPRTGIDPQRLIDLDADWFCALEDAVVERDVAAARDRAHWHATEHLLATLIEVTHAHYRFAMRAAGVKAHQLPGPLRIDRPTTSTSKPAVRPPRSAAELRHALLGGLP